VPPRFTFVLFAAFVSSREQLFLAAALERPSISEGLRNKRELVSKSSCTPSCRGHEGSAARKPADGRASRHRRDRPDRRVTGWASQDFPGGSSRCEPRV